MAERACTGVPRLTDNATAEAAPRPSRFLERIVDTSRQVIMNGPSYRPAIRPKGLPGKPNL